MKRSPHSRSKAAGPGPRAAGSALLAFGPHPDDIEFGCGGIVARETRAGRAAHFAVCSRGESGTNGTPAQRAAEAERATEILGATVEFLELDGDAHLELRAAHALKLAAVIRRVRPAVVLAPTVELNQHPDHWRLGQLVRDATRLARYGGVRELRQLPPHAGARLYFYAVTTEAEPPGALPVLVDVSPPEILAAWTAAMSAHASQLKTKDYVEHQLLRARLHGYRAGLSHAQPLWPNEAVVLEAFAASLSQT